MVIMIIAIIIGLLMCFFGYKLFRVWLVVAGLLLGGYSGYYLGGLVGGAPWPIIGAVVIGLLLAVLAYFLYRVGIVVVGALLGVALLGVILGAFGVELVWWTGLLGAVIGGVIAGMFANEFIVIGSSFQGAFTTVSGIYALIANKNFLETRNQDLLNLPWYLLVAVIALMILAISVQMKHMKKKPNLI